MRIPVNTHLKLNTFNGPINFSDRISNLDDTIISSILKLITRTEYEVPEYGRLFKPIEEEFLNPELSSIANRVKFSIKPSTDKNNQTGRILKMEIFSLKGNSISPIFECGPKEEILKILKDEKLPSKIKELVSKADMVLLKKQLGD